MLLDAQVDAQPDASPPNTVFIETFGDTPLFMVYRDGTGPWQTVVDDQLHIHDAYQVVAVCGDSQNGYDTGIEASTFTESMGHTYLPCYMTYTDVAPHAAVSGTMVQPGMVATGFVQAEGTTPNWHYQLSVDQGTHDVIAVGNDRIQIRHALAITTDTTLPAIDLVSDGAAMPAVPLTVNGTDSTDTLSTSLALSTNNEFVMLSPQPGATPHVVPDVQLVVGDVQLLWLTASSPASSRSAFMQYTAASPTTFTLMPRLTGIVFGATSASWATLPLGTAELYMISGITSVHGTATPGWLGSATELSIDLDIPGFENKWKPGAIDYRDFTVRAHQGSMSLSTSVSQSTMMRRPRAAKNSLAEAAKTVGLLQRRILSN